MCNDDRAIDFGSEDFRSRTIDGHAGAGPAMRCVCVRARATWPSALLRGSRRQRGRASRSGRHMRACVSLSAASAWAPGPLVRERLVGLYRKDLDPCAPAG